MSMASNTGPLKRARSDSQHSLYSDNSDHSDSPFPQPLPKQTSVHSRLDPPPPRVEPPPPPPQKTPPKREQSMKSVPRFPQIRTSSHKSGVDKGRGLFNSSFVNDAAERQALFNEKVSSVEIREERGRGAGGARYGEGAGSSQGSRWLRSQSLGVSREQRSFKHLVRHFHRHGSVLVESLNRFWEHFEGVEKQLGQGPYRLSLFDSLESTKLKMEGYLQRRVNLGNLRGERPGAEWSQEQFMLYYGSYQRVLLAEETQQVHRPFTLKKYKNCVFFGRMQEGRKEEGILHYFSGRCFEGAFRDDQKHWGLELDEKELYLGEFRKGLRHGEGILKTAEALLVGRFTCGEFCSAPREESGTASLFSSHPEAPLARKGFEITHSQLRVYEGGLCVSRSGAGDVFVGGVGGGGEKQEEGLEVFANGDIYIGRYESDSPEGYGEYYWENGSHYRGQFLSGMRHGRGVWRMVNGDSYEGEYMNDKKNGKGSYLWKNGSRYVGNFENDYRHGYGEMYWQDGRVYKGKWLNGIEKNTLITLEPKGAPVPRARPAFRTLQGDGAQRKKVPLDKLKSLYNPSYH